MIGTEIPQDDYVEILTGEDNMPLIETERHKLLANSTSDKDTEYDKERLNTYLSQLKDLLNSKTENATLSNFESMIENLHISSTHT